MRAHLCSTNSLVHTVKLAFFMFDRERQSLVINSLSTPEVTLKGEDVKLANCKYSKKYRNLGWKQSL